MVINQLPDFWLQILGYCCGQKALGSIQENASGFLKPAKLFKKFYEGLKSPDLNTCNTSWIIEKAWEFQKKYLLLLYWLRHSLWLCGSQQTWKFLMRIPASEYCLLRSLYAGQEATVRTGHGTSLLTGYQLGKEYIKAVYCQPVNLTYM